MGNVSVVAIARNMPTPIATELSAVVIRADGRREELGVVSRWRMTWWQRLMRWAQVNSASLVVIGAAGAAMLLGLPWLVPIIGATLQVNTGRAVVTALLTGGTAYPKYGGWGTGAGTTGATDTTLFTEDSGGSPAYARQTAVMSQVTTSTTNDTAQFVWTITANASKTITNAGLFDASSSGNLYFKGDFTGIPLNTNDSIQFTGKVQYS